MYTAALLGMRGMDAVLTPCKIIPTNKNRGTSMKPLSVTHPKQRRPRRSPSDNEAMTYDPSSSRKPLSKAKSTMVVTTGKNNRKWTVRLMQMRTNKGFFEKSYHCFDMIPE
ncbi:hypothetical protein CEXT_738191 [Caerostris extrusa]|uniref:Uncharacterized protein n=1 Tax=Caerostris extrusa TaxID=172846 RepID=A0AAV4X6W3_CAEEX|nr:hypothetical protein CEXT_738191 [Caerostris extrusa]